jgi:hypothetical protein
MDGSTVPAEQLSNIPWLQSQPIPGGQPSYSLFDTEINKQKKGTHKLKTSNWHIKLVSNITISVMKINYESTTSICIGRVNKLERKPI